MPSPFHSFGSSGAVADDLNFNSVSTIGSISLSQLDSDESSYESDLSSIDEEQDQHEHCGKVIEFKTHFRAPGDDQRSVASNASVSFEEDDHPLSVVHGDGGPGTQIDNFEDGDEWSCTIVFGGEEESSTESSYPKISRRFVRPTRRRSKRPTRRSSEYSVDSLKLIEMRRKAAVAADDDDSIDISSEEEEEEDFDRHRGTFQVNGRAKIMAPKRRSQRDSRRSKRHPHPQESHSYDGASVDSLKLIALSRHRRKASRDDRATEPPMFASNQGRRCIAVAPRRSISSSAA